MSKKPAALPIFGDAYLADTMHLSLEEHGAYFLLMLAAWRSPNCALPDDNAKLARICRCSTKRFAPIKANVLEMWDLTPQGWVQKRLKKEHDYVSQKAAHNRRAAEARWNNQPTENIDGDGCERISERNAPPPPPIYPEANASGRDGVENQNRKPAEHEVRDEPLPDPEKVMFDAGKKLLAESGIPNARAGPVLGKWKRDFGAEAVIIALGKAKREGAVDPISFIEGCLRNGNNRNGSNYSSGKVNHFDAVCREVAESPPYSGQPDDDGGMSLLGRMGS